MDFTKITKATNIISKITTSLSTIFLLLTFLFNFNKDSGYFVNGFFSISFLATYASGMVLPFICSVFCNNDQVIKTPDNAEKDKTLLALLGTVAILAATINIMLNKIDHETITLLIGSGLGFFGIYLMLIAISGYNKSFFKMACLFASALFSVGLNLSSISNYSRPINSVENTLESVFGICFLIYILYEGNRIHTGEHSKWHYPAMLTAFLSGLSLSVAYIFAYILSAANEEVRFYQMFLMLVATVCIGIEIKRFVADAKSHTPEEWDAIAQAELEINVEEAEEASLEETVVETVEETVPETIPEQTTAESSDCETPSDELEINIENKETDE